MGGALLFFIFQVVSLVSLILSIAVPLRDKQGDCDADNGWVSAIIREVTCKASSSTSFGVAGSMACRWYGTHVWGR